MRWYENKIDVTGYITLNNQRYPVCDIRDQIEKWEHCPVCDEHVPDVRYTGTIHDLEQLGFSADSCILADGSVACEDGHGGLMVELCADCIDVNRRISERNGDKL